MSAKGALAIVLLSALLLGSVLGSVALAAPVVQVGQNVSVLTHGLVITDQSVQAAWCDFPLVMTNYSTSKDGDAMVRIIVRQGVASKMLALTFDPGEDSATMLYVADKSGRVVRVIAGADMPDSPCDLF